MRPQLHAEVRGQQVVSIDALRDPAGHLHGAPDAEVPCERCKSLLVSHQPSDEVQAGVQPPGAEVVEGPDAVRRGLGITDVAHADDHDPGVGQAEPQPGELSGLARELLHPRRPVHAERQVEGLHAVHAPYLLTEAARVDDER